MKRITEKEYLAAIRVVNDYRDQINSEASKAKSETGEARYIGQKGQKSPASMTIGKVYRLFFFVFSDGQVSDQFHVIDEHGKKRKFIKTNRANSAWDFNI